MNSTLIQTIFIGGGVGNTIAVSKLIDALFELSLSQNDLIPQQKIVIIDRYRYFAGGVPWGKETHPTSFFNNPTRLTEPQQEFKTWLLNNLENLLNYVKEMSGKVGKNWLDNNRVNLCNGNIDEIYFPRRFYGFFLEDKLYKTLQKARDLNIPVILLEALVERVTLNKNDSKTVLLKDNMGYQVIMQPVMDDSLYPQYEFHGQDPFYGNLQADNICLGIGALPPPQFSEIQNSDGYIPNFYEDSGIEHLKRVILSTFQQKNNLEKVRLTFLGSGAGLLEMLLEIDSNLEIRNRVKIISISHQGKSRNAAILSGKMPPYKTQFLKKKLLLLNN